jgi:hypothetical protein
MPEMIRACGPTGYVLVALSALAFALAATALALSALRWKHAQLGAALALVVSLAPFIAGIVGTLRGRQAVDRAVAGVAAQPGMRLRLQRQGYFEVQRCTRAGMTLGALPVVLGAAAMLLALALRNPRGAGSDETRAAD